MPVPPWRPERHCDCLDHICAATDPAVDEDLDLVAHRVDHPFERVEGGGHPVELPAPRDST